MSYTYELFEVNDGYGFHIVCEGNPIITQEYMPNTAGFISMTQEQAIEQANIIIGRLVE